jgi:hypothetical protein
MAINLLSPSAGRERYAPSPLPPIFYHEQTREGKGESTRDPLFYHSWKAASTLIYSRACPELTTLFFAESFHCSGTPMPIIPLKTVHTKSRD